MTGARRTLLVLAVLCVPAAGIWLVAGPGSPGAAPAAAPVAPAPRPTDSTWPLLAAGPSVTPPVTPTAAAPAVTSSPAAPAAAGTPAAAPFVQNFAGQPGVKPLKPLPSPTKTHYVRPNVDGCDHNYGEVTQCVPWTFPAGTTDKCAWLAAHGFKTVKVAAEDRQKLDTDGNRIACDT